MKRLKPMTWQTFLEFLSERKVFCFGAGIQGERMGEFLVDAGLGTHLLGYIDNHKAGTGSCVALMIASIQSCRWMRRCSSLVRILLS